LGEAAVAVAASAVAQRLQCRCCKLDLDPRAEACWFCSTPVESASPRSPAAPAAPPVDDDSIRFARGLLIGIAVVLVPFAIHLTGLAG
jgi:hypothetical protein